MKMWTVLIGDQYARSVQFNFDLHCTQKVFGSLSLRKVFTLTSYCLKLLVCDLEF